MNLAAVKEQIIEQQKARFPDQGPNLAPLGGALYRLTPVNPRTYHANIVGFMQTTPDDVPAHIRTICEYYARYVPELLWQINQDEYPFDMASILLREGFCEHEELLVMVHSGSILAAQNPRVSVRRVVTRSDMVQYARIATIVFGGNDTPGRAEWESAAERYWHALQSGWTRYFIGYLDSQPVGTVALTDEVIPLIQSVATLKSARRQGVASAMVAYATNMAVSYGADITSLYVNHHSDAERIYHKLGFQPLFTQRIYMKRF